MKRQRKISRRNTQVKK